MSTNLDLSTIDPWLKLCGACDVGIGECNHPDGDYRPVMLALVREVERMRSELDEALESVADMAQAQAVVDATRKMANDANARLRAELLAALDREDDGRTSLSGYISHLVAQRDLFKAALVKAAAELDDRPTPETHDCDCALLPLGSAPIERCVKPGGHAGMHQNEAGEQWTDPLDEEDQ